jgi:hypothetical protein
MSRRRAIPSLAAVALLGVGLALAGSAAAEVVQRGNLRVAFEGELTPRTLPRSQLVPVDVAMGGRISTTDGSSPPQLRRISIAINRYGRIAPAGRPVCQLEQIQPATTAGALEACRRSLVGEGSFSADVLLPTQAPFPSFGKVSAFSGAFHGKPAILAHVYGTEPTPTSYTLPFLLRRTRGTYGTLITAALPQATSEWGYVTGLSLRLGRTAAGAGRPSYVAASCPAPRGFPGAVFPLARTIFSFAGGRRVEATLQRSCRAQG